MPTKPGLRAGLEPQRFRKASGIDPDGGQEVFRLLDSSRGGTTAAAAATNAVPAAIDGTNGDDVMIGTVGNETLNGLGGNDSLDGRLGVDTLAGGQGADRFVFSTRLATNTADVIYDFTIAEGDLIELVAGFGSVFPSLAPGALPASAYSINFQNQTADTRIIYYAQYGILYYDIDGTGFRDPLPFAQIQTGLALTPAHFIVTSNGNAVPQATEGDDVLIGSPGDDYFSALGGNDELDGRYGADVLRGGPGDDLYHFDGYDTIVEQPGEGNADTVRTSVSFQLRPEHDIEIVRTADDAGTAAIDLRGNDIANRLYGNAGNNVLIGGNGDDFLSGGAGTNYLYGDAGNDTYHVGLGLDIIFENENDGVDTVVAASDFTLPDNLSIEILATDNAAGTEPIALGGNNLNNVIYGNAGDNILYGKGGNDWLEGLGGNDTYFIDSAGDVVREAAGGGNDRIYAGGDYTLYTGQQVEVLSTDFHAGTAAINLGGNELNNIIYGNAGNNILYGKGGNDWLEGLGGDDGYYVDSAGDYVAEGAGGGNDRILAGGDYTLYAGQQIEILSTDWNLGTSPYALGGNERDNVIYGNAGNNILYGKGGNDTLLGGGGNDQFWFTDAPGVTNVDLIYGFGSQDDKLILFQNVFTALSSGSMLAASAFVTGTAAQDADDRIIYNSATGALSYDADGNGAGAAIQFATLNGAPVINAGDFSVI